MLISIENLKKIYTDKDFSKFSDTRITAKLAAIEQMIRAYTRNNFQNRNIRAEGYVINNVIYGDFALFKVGDTVQLSKGLNSGLYTVKTADNASMTVDAELFDDLNELITKVVYPLDVIDGCIELLDYDLNVKDLAKSGLSSETISRHSVSFKNLNEQNTIEGYPSEMFGFLKKYCKWRT